MKVKSLSRVRLLATPWTAAYQAPPSMGFSRQEYWYGLPLLSPVYCYPAYLTSIQGILCEMPGWMNRKLASKLLEVSTLLDMQMILL